MQMVASFCTRMKGGGFTYSILLLQRLATSSDAKSLDGDVFCERFSKDAFMKSLGESGINIDITKNIYRLD